MKKMLIVLFVFLSLSSLGANGQTPNRIGVNKTQIALAKKIASQSSFGSDSSWSCGPNALARLLTMLTRNTPELLPEEHDYTDRATLTKLVANCPASFGQPTSLGGYAVSFSLALWSVGSLCYVPQEGFLDLMPELILGLSATAPFAIEGINKYCGVGKVGPPPGWLVSYANDILKAEGKEDRIKLHTPSTENGAEVILRKELMQGLPVMVLINFGPLAWHYIVIVAYEESDDGTVDYVYLDSKGDSGGDLYRYSASELFSKMDFHRELTTGLLRRLIDYCLWPVDAGVGRMNLITIK